MMFKKLFAIAVISLGIISLWCFMMLETGDGVTFANVGYLSVTAIIGLPVAMLGVIILYRMR